MRKTNETIYDLIRKWSREKGIYKNGDSKTQTLKLGEEFGELCKAVLKRNDDEVYDAVGDCVVVLVNVIYLYELEKLELNQEPLILESLESCVEKAYEVISKRTGSMQNGTFVKNEVRDDLFLNQECPKCGSPFCDC